MKMHRLVHSAIPPGSDRHRTETGGIGVGPCATGLVLQTLQVAEQIMRIQSGDNGHDGIDKIWAVSHGSFCPLCAQRSRLVQARARQCAGMWQCRNAADSPAHGGLRVSQIGSQRNVGRDLWPPAIVQHG